MYKFKIIFYIHFIYYYSSIFAKGRINLTRSTFRMQSMSFFLRADFFTCGSSSRGRPPCNTLYFCYIFLERIFLYIYDFISPHVILCIQEVLVCTQCMWTQWLVCTQSRFFLSCNYMIKNTMWLQWLVCTQSRLLLIARYWIQNQTKPSCFDSKKVSRIVN